MAKNHVQPGKTMTWTNGAAEPVRSGDVVMVGDMCCIALGDIAPDEAGELGTEEVWKIKKATGAMTHGQEVFWKADADPVDGTPGTGALIAVYEAGAKYAGRCFAPAGADDAAVDVKINCLPIPARQME